MGIKLKLREEYFLVVFVMLGLFFYLNLDKLPLSHPGNIKAADPFYHTVSVESILDTKQWNYYDYYLGLGTEKAINHQPPLIYIASAMLSEFTNLPAWITLYFFVCLSQALFIIIVYLITYEAFENKKIALMASGLTVLPAPVSFWLYGVYIGFWLQVPSYFFVMAIVWLTIKYFKTRKDPLLLAIGFSISSIILLHLADMMIVFFEMIALGIIILIDLARKKDVFSFVKKGFLIGILPLLSFITVLPRILYLWSGLGTSMFTLGLYSLDRNVFPKEQYGGMVWPHFDFFPLYIKILFFAGMFVLLLISILYFLSLFNKKFGFPYLKTEKGRVLFSMKKDDLHVSYLIIFFVVTSFFMTVYLSPLIFSDPYYLGGRARALQPFFVYPVVAYAVWILISLIEKFALQDKKKSGLFELSFCIVFVLLVIITSMAQYSQVAEQLKGEHITEAKWNAYKWLHENTPKEATVLFFGGIQQGEHIYSKRISASMSIEDLNKFIQEFSSTNKTPETIHTEGWGGNTLREGHWKYEKSFFSFGNYSEFNTTVKIDFFDYIIFQNFANEMVNINMFFANEYVKKGYKAVYNDGFSIILKNER
jgi:hypothetical protein